MANIEAQDSGGDFAAVQRRARRSGHVQQAQTMLLAAGIAAFSIVAVAAAMLTTLL